MNEARTRRRPVAAVLLLLAFASGILLPLAGIAAAWLPVLAPRDGGVPEAWYEFLVGALRIMLMTVAAIVVVYTVRHVVFTLNRMFGHQRHPYLDVDTADWPRVVVLIPAHDEAAVIAHALEALVDVDYPRERLRIMPIDDRSTDGTWAIITDYAGRHPGLVTPLKRTTGRPGKAAVIRDATESVREDVIIVFDADYVPGRGLIKQLVAPFFDAEVGAVMGRVVPHNTARNLLTRLLDLERAGGYQVDQQARMNLRLVPQYGGSVGGARTSALRAVGGWRDDALAEDTDLTYRLLLHGYKTVYENRCECYEEVPEVWQERNRQIMRWAKGHNQAALRYFVPLLLSRRLNLLEKIDGLLLLGVYVVAPLLIMGFLCAFALYLLGERVLPPALGIVLGLATFSSLGNFAAFFEIAAALHIDGSRHRIRIVPLNFIGFLVSLVNITRACLSLVVEDLLIGKELRWEKTARYRNGPPAS